MLLVFSDPHIRAFKMFDSYKTGKSRRLQGIIEALQQVKDIAQEKNVPTLCAGDIFDTFSFVENEALNAAAALFSTWKDFYYIAGNHDLQTKADNYTEAAIATHSFSKWANCTYIDGKVVTLPNGTTLAGLSWRNPRTFADQVFPVADIFVGHQLIETPYTPGCLKVDVLMEKYKLAIFGDIHIAQDLGKILVPGAPLQHSFKDEGQDRGCWLIHNDFSKEFIPLKAAKFITVGSLKDTKDDGNYYRVQNALGSISKKEQNENVIVQKSVDHSFRESGLSIAKDDPALIKEYMGITAPTIIDDAYYTKGLSILSSCHTTVRPPQNYRVASVLVRNFGSFRGSHLFENEEGMFLISGDNGTGKTTILEAIYWGLFGETTKGLSADDVINDYEGKDCHVRVLLENPEGGRLATKRYRNDTNFANDFWFEPSDSAPVKRERTSETQKDLETYLGTSADFFKNLNYFSQENFSFFSSLTDAKQKELCKVFMPLDRFEAGKIIAATEVAKHTQTFTTNSSNILACENQLAMVETAEAEAFQQLAQWDTAHAQRVALKKLEAKDAEDTEDVLKKTVEETLLQVQEAKNNPPVVDISTLETQYRTTTALAEQNITKLQEELSAVAAEHDGIIIDSDPGLLGQYLATKKQLSDNLQSLQTLAKERQLAKEEGNATVHEYTGFVGTSSTAHALAASNTTRYEKELAAISTVCNTCGAALEDSKVQSLITAAQTKVAISRQEQETAQQTLSAWEAALTEAKVANAQAEANLQEVLAQITEAGSLITTLDTNYTKGDNERSATKIKAKADLRLKIAQLSAEIQAATAQLANDQRVLQLEMDNCGNEQKIAYAEKLVALARLHEEASTKVKMQQLQVSFLHKELDQLLMEKNPYDGTCTKWATEKTQLVNTLKTKKEQQALVEKDLTIAAFWEVGFSNQGMVSYLLDAFAKEFTTAINEVLLNISNGRFYAILSTQKKLKNKNEYREKFEFLVYVDQKKRSYAALSGGQKARVNLSTVIVLNKLVSKYFGLNFYPFGLIVLDELFTFLDDAGVEAVFYELQTILKHSSIYVVTNKTDVKAMFTNVINVTYSEEKGSELLLTMG